MYEEGGEAELVFGGTLLLNPPIGNANQMHVCRKVRWQDCIGTSPGSGQGRVNFCSSQGEHVQGPVVILYHLMARERDFVPDRRGSLQSGKQGAAG